MKTRTITTAAVMWVFLTGIAYANDLVSSSEITHSTNRRPVGTVVAWGRNFEGETDVSAAATHIVAIAAGDYHSLTLRLDGKVFAWGYNDGDGDTVVPPGLTNVAAIACGGHHKSRVSHRLSLCENSPRADRMRKSTLTLSFWRTFIFGESDLNRFFVFQNDQN